MGCERLEARALLSGDGPGGGSATPMLPDLTPWADETRGFMYDWTVEQASRSQTLLYLSTSMANVGDGPLELRGSTVHEDGTQDVLQRVYQDDGSHVDRVAGEFIFHPSHGHIHFEGFAEYNLRTVLPDEGVGDVVATGGKTSFCLIDLEPYKLTLPGAPEENVYDGCGTTQGISVGWADVYDRGLPDQWIDVTNVPEGPYWLEVVSDPDDHIVEIDETNNVARILIDLHAPRPLEPDAYEPNDTRGAAAIVGPGPVLLEHASIHAPENDDWYRWTATDAGPVEIVAHFNHGAGDVDLFAYDANGILLDVSDGVTNVERITLNVTAGDVRYVKVVGYDGATNPDYSLSIGLGDESAPLEPDALEPNSSFATATQLAPLRHQIEDLNIHSASDVDYFRWTSPFNGRLTVNVQFDNTLGDVDLYLHNMLHEQIDASTGATNVEEVSTDVAVGQLLYFRVEGYEERTNPAYTLTVTIERPLPGDVDDSGGVDLVDLNLVRNNFGLSGIAIPGDSDGDGDVDLADLNDVRNNFGTSIVAPLVMPTRSVETKLASGDAIVMHNLLFSLATRHARHREALLAWDESFADWNNALA